MPPGAEVVRRFHGRGFFDLTMMQWAFYDAFGILPADVGQGPRRATAGDFGALPKAAQGAARMDLAVNERLSGFFGVSGTIHQKRNLSSIASGS